MPKNKTKAKTATKPGIGQLFLKNHYGDPPDGGPLKIGHILYLFYEHRRSIPDTIRAVTAKLQHILTEPGACEIHVCPHQITAVTVKVLGRFKHLSREKEMSAFADVCSQEFTNFTVTPEQSTQAVKNMDVGPSTCGDCSPPQRNRPVLVPATDEHVPGPSTPQHPIPSPGSSTRKMLQPIPQDMQAMDVTELRTQLENARREISALKRKLNETDSLGNFSGEKDTQVDDSVPWRKKSKLDNASIERYSRQLILPEIGVKGQLRLCNSSALIVGAGGLGCPAAIYLAAAGIGRLGIVDYDDVELGNLHRQILHTQDRIGHSKSTSISTSVEKLNSSVRCEPHQIQLDSSNAMDIIEKYDIVLDCTDNVATRYLLNDACVLAGKPLVSGSALRFEGQLTVYNHEGGPCYRCLYPKPPPPETVTNCSSGGVLGVVPGIIGCLQALETLKIAIGMTASFSQKLLLLDALDGGLRTIKLRARQPGCAVCGKQPSITRLIDYEEFCGASATDKCISLHILPPSDRITVNDLSTVLQEDTAAESSVLLDVRPAVEFEICRLPHFINIPIDEVSNDKSIEELRDAIVRRKPQMQDKTQVLVICRRGNDSQLAVKTLQEKLDSVPAVIKDIKGGLTAWTGGIDPDFPKY